MTNAPAIPPPIRQVSPFQVPLFWMFLGPPALRIGVAEDRSGLSSLSGDQDIWNYIRLAWWIFWGLVAIVSLLRHGGITRQLTARLGTLPYWAAAFIGGLGVGSFASEYPLFSLANVAMMVMLIVAATDLAVKIFAGVISTARCLRTILWLAVALLVFVGILYLLYPQLRYEGWFGYRLRGESFAYVPLLSVILILVGSHFVLATEGSRKLVYIAVVAFGFYWLLLSQTRSAYLCLAVAFAVLAWHHLALGRNRVALAAVVIAGLTGVVVVMMLYGNSDRVTWYVDSTYNRFVVRDYWALQDEAVRERSLATLNGRTEAAAVLIEGVLDQPWGFGYIGGVRSFMARPDIIERLPDEAFIGAHNGFLEVLGGGGFLALIGYLGTFGWVLFHSRRFGNVESRVIQALFLVLVVESIFESEIAYPFHQSPVLLWFVGAITMAAVARESARQAAIGQPVRAPRPRPAIRAVGQLP